MGRSIRIDTFTPVKLLNNPLASCSIRDFDFYYKSISLLITLPYTQFALLFNIGIFNFPLDIIKLFQHIIY